MIEYNPRGGRLCGFTACLDRLKSFSFLEKKYEVHR